MSFTKCCAKLEGSNRRRGKNRATQKQKEAGDELHKFADGLQAKGGLSYKQALRKACVMNPTYVTQYTGHEVRDRFNEIVSTGKRYADTSAANFMTLANIALGHKLPNGRVRWSAADRAVMLQPATVRQNVALSQLGLLVNQAF